MPIDAEIVILNPEWIWRFLEGDRLSLEHTAPKLSTIERCYNSLNGSALELRRFSKLSRNHIRKILKKYLEIMNLRQINVGCWLFLVV